MKIRGNTVGTPMKRPDFNQTDPKKSDFIKNNPLPQITEEDEGKVLIVDDGKFVLGEQTNEKLELDLTNLKAITIGNTWLLDEEKIKWGEGFTKDFKFVSNGISFEQMTCTHSTDSGNDEYGLQYRNSDTNTYRDAYRCDLYGGGWIDDAFKTIRTAEDINLEDIATKVESTNDLITDAKTLIDAINELSKSVKFVPVTYVEPVEDEDGNVIEEGGWFAERKDEFGNFVRDVAITALVGGENKFVFYERQPLIEGGAFSPIYIDKFIEIESVDNAIDFIDQLIASTWKRLPEESQEGIIEFIDNANTQLKKDLTNIYNWIMGLGDLPEDFVDKANETIQNINKATKDTVDGIVEWIDGTTDGAVTGAKKTIDNIYNYAYGWVTNTINEALDLARQAAEDAAEALEKGLTDLYNQIKEETEAAWDKFWGDVEDYVSKGLEPLTTGFNELKADIDENVKEGLANAQEWIDDTGKQVAYKMDEIVEFFGGDLVPDQNFAQVTESGYNAFVKNNSIDTLNTLDTTVVGGINELNGILKGNTWILDEEALLQANSFTKNFKFVSNGIEFEQMVYRVETDGANDYYILQYRNDTTGEYRDAYNGGWIDRAFRTVFTLNTSISLKDIATIDNYTREDLDTNDKTIVGAINEVNASADDAKATLQNIIDGYTEVDSAKFAKALTDQGNLNTTNKTVVGAINEVNNKVVSNITKLEDNHAYGITKKSNGVAWEGQSRIHYGDGKYVDIVRSTNIPLVAGENVTFEVDQESEIVKVNAEVDTSNLATVDKVKRIDTWAVGVENIDKDDGIYWDEGFIFFDENDNAITDGTIHHRIPIVAGSGVEFENDGNVITINATGGGSAEDNVVGTWVFNYDLELTGGIDAYFNFTGYDADGVEREFNRLCIDAIIGDGVLQDYCVEYYDIDGERCLVCDTMDAFWINDMSRTITINEQPNDNDFITCVKRNASKKGAVSYVAKYVVSLSGGENVVNIINKLQEDYPDYQLGVWSLVEFTGATSGLYGLTINHYGGNLYNISGADFGTFYSMANNVKDWSQVSVWGFSGEFQPPIPYCDDSNNGQVLKVVNGVPTWV